jgi:hypothetical protein
MACTYPQFARTCKRKKDYENFFTLPLLCQRKSIGSTLAELLPSAKYERPARERRWPAKSNNGSPSITKLGLYQ